MIICRCRRRMSTAACFAERRVNMKITAVIAAAGSGTRMGRGNKLLIPINGKTVIERTLEAFQKSGCINEIVLVTSPEGEIAKLARAFSKVSHIVCGGESRAESVKRGAAFSGDCDFIAVHDGARPFVSPELIERIAACAEKSGAAVPCVPITDTLKKISGGKIEKTLDRSRIFGAQTPQIFRKDLLCRAYEEIQFDVTDDSSAVEKIHPVAYVEGDSENIKLTTKFDIIIAAEIAKKRDRKI